MSDTESRGVRAAPWLAGAIGVLWFVHVAALVADADRSGEWTRLQQAWGLLTPPLLLASLFIHPRLKRPSKAGWARFAWHLMFVGSGLLSVNTVLAPWAAWVPGFRYLLLVLGVPLAAAGFVAHGIVRLASGSQPRSVAWAWIVGPVGFLVGVDGRATDLLPFGLGWVALIGSAAFAWPWLSWAFRRLSEELPPARLSRWARVAAVTATTLLLLAPGAVALVAHQAAASLLAPRREASEDLPSQFNLSYETIGFASRDGVALHGWWMGPEPEDYNGCTIIFLHGWSDHLNQSLEVAPFLSAAGYNVLAFDFRAHGRSGGHISTFGVDEVLDARAAIDYAVARTAASTPCVGLIGYSMGAATALKAAAEDPRVGGVVADSAFARIQHLVNNVFTYETCKHLTCLPKYPFGPVAVLDATWSTNRPFEGNAPLLAVRGMSRPALLIQGLDDFFITPHEDGLALVDALGSEGEVWFVPGASHVKARAVAGSEYEDRVLRFFERSLRQDPSA